MTFRCPPLPFSFGWGLEAFSCQITEAMTKLPISSILRLFVAAVGRSVLLAANVLVMLMTFVLFPPETSLLPVREALPESELELDKEPESSDDDEHSEDSEPLSQLSEGLVVGRVGLKPIRERGSSTHGADGASTFTVVDFGVRTSSSDSDDSDPKSYESSAVISCEQSRTEVDAHLWILNSPETAVITSLALTDSPGVILFASTLRDSSNSGSEPELDSLSDSGSKAFSKRSHCRVGVCTGFE